MASRRLVAAAPVGGANGGVGNVSAADQGSIPSFGYAEAAAWQNSREIP